MKVLLFAAAAALATAQTLTYVRASVALNPGGQGAMPDYDLYMNDVLVKRNVVFREVSPYMSVGAGRVTVGIKAVGSSASDPYVKQATFTAPSNSFYTVGFTGPLQGPAGQVATNSNPFVNPDMRRVPNPGRSTGLWYRWSETNAVIDFRAITGDPFNSACNATCNSWLANPPGVGCPTCAITTARDDERISDLLPKTVIQLSEFEPGTYSFYPTLPGKNDPLWNARFNGGAGGVVGDRGRVVDGAVAIAGGARGKWYDFFASGDSLLTPGPNNLELRTTVTAVEFDAGTGCTYVLDNSNTRVLATSNGAASLGVAAVAVVGTLVAAFLAL